MKFHNYKKNTQILLIGVRNSFICGLCSGLIIAPNDFNIEYKNKKSQYYNFKNYCVSPILITGFLGILIYTSTPFLIYNFITSGVYFDKLIDKYDVTINRYHQLGYNDNKYYAPSSIYIKIKEL